MEDCHVAMYMLYMPYIGNTFNMNHLLVCSRGKSLSNDNPSAIHEGPMCYLQLFFMMVTL